MNDTIKIEVRLGCEVLGEYAFQENKDILVGRTKSADIFLNAPAISRKHAILIPVKEGVFVRDLSRNAIFRNNQPIQSGEKIAYGTALRTGPFTLVLGRKKTDRQYGIDGLKKKALSRLIEHVELAAIERSGADLRRRVEAALVRIISEHGISADISMPGLVKELADEALGLGPLEQLIADETISEIMVVDRKTIFVERGGILEKTNLSFTSEKAVRTIVERIITPLGRRIDESSPMVDARLADGSRVNAVIPPLAIRGACITIRKFPDKVLETDDLITFGSMNRTMADFLRRAVAARANIVISGGTGSGKTTLLGVLSSAIPESERIITVEDACELRLSQVHVVSLESRPANAEGKGQFTIRDLVRNALRMRPDRIVVGECRGGEALDMLQAMNTGHDGSLTTVHANSPVEAISRLETLCLMAGLDLPARAIREQIASAVDLIVQQVRQPDGSRRVTSITEVAGMEEEGLVRLHEIFRFVVQSGEKRNGEFVATGWLPTCLGEAALALGAPEKRTKSCL
ncbi:MAG: Flp pilus assembly complex ATPase component [Proteobacteria bacterium]|nr:Flp pilus assembly complex ATPase component [Pseudomonadota bacterium]